MKGQAVALSTVAKVSEAQRREKRGQGCRSIEFCLLSHGLDSARGPDHRSGLFPCEHQNDKGD